MTPFRISKTYLLSQKRPLIIYVFIILASSAITILSPYIIGDFIDALIYGADINVIFRFAVIFGGLGLLKIIKGFITSLIYVKMQVKMSYDFNMDVIKHIQGLSLSYSSKEDSAYLTQRINSDTNSLIVFCISILQNIITSAITLIVPFIILLTMNWLISVLMLVFIVMYTMLYFVFKKPLYKAGLALRESFAKFYAKLFEQLKYLKLIKMNSIQPEINFRANESFIDMRTASINNQKINYFYSSLDGFISTIAQITLFVIGGIQILLGNFTIGMFTIFTSYFSMMLGAARYFFGLGAYYQNIMVSCDRITEILRQPLEKVGDKIINGIEKIEIVNLSFAYDKHNNIINDFNASFVKGNIYGIAGANGAGKSTIITLLMGMYADEYKGVIKYDDTDIRELDMSDIRKRLIGFSEQEPQLISDSIQYNLSFGINKVTNLSYFTKILNMQDFITNNGLEFEINENNTNTSGGEKQKISILKVLCKNPDVMVFDEPTSALDANTAKMFMQYLCEIKHDKIIIIISHDDWVIRYCDAVMKIY